MLNLKSFLAVDFGAGSLKLAEFEITEAGGLVLRAYTLKRLGAEGAQEATREGVVLKTLRELLAERGEKTARSLNVCAPGFQVFSKFVKLPPVDANKVTQIIQYEAQQNVPFPLAEVVWDYQIMGSSASGELEVLLVAIKSEVVEGLFRIAETAKLRLQLCDVSPAALCNAFRYNYGDLDDCTMLLDIGAKTSNLLFFEKGKVFSRGISLGANAITQDFANESRLKFDAAEEIKIREGFVSLGGAYEEPENPHQAAISKIARQFMTRLHIQVNQTIQFYRGQMNGAAPQRLFLAGGAAVMPYTAQFFAEKLNIPVEYFNPFRNVQIDPAVNLETLSHVAHSFGEVVGLGLRNLANCPVEMNLMPDTTLRWQRFNEKKPYFIATVLSFVAVAFAVGFIFQQLAQSKKAALQNIAPKVQEAQARWQRFRRAENELRDAQQNARQVAAWMEDRYYWGDVLAGLRRVLIQSEDAVQKKLSADQAGVQVGIWIEQMTTINALAAGTGPGGYPGYPNYYPGGYPGYPGNQGIPRYPGAAAEMDRAMPQQAQPPPGTPGQTGAAAPGALASSNEVSTIHLVCRAVNLSSVVADANRTVIYTLQDKLQHCPLFDPKGTQLVGEIVPDPTTGTFTFNVTVALKKPLKL